jgi:hypothetical protein
MWQAALKRARSAPAVFFPLVAHGADDDVVVDDLEQTDAARCVALPC